MLKKKVFLFSLGLNFFFYMVLAACIYGYQIHEQHQELLDHYHHQVAVIDQEMTDRKEFYQHWFENFYELPAGKTASDIKWRELFFKNYHIQYLGKIVDNKLLSIGPANRPPPFFPDSLINNGRYLFYKNQDHLFFTYTMSDAKKAETAAPYVVVQFEDFSYVINQALRTTSNILIFESSADQGDIALFSSFDPKQAAHLMKKFSGVALVPQNISLAQQSYFVIPLKLHQDEHLIQVMLFAFNTNSFLFTSTLGMAVLLLALLCISTFLLYYGYQKSRD